jgi:hypothetical protein
MSEENVEVVRAAIEALARSRPEEMAEGVERTWDPDGDFHPPQKFLESRPCHGREEISRYYANWRATWDRLEHEIREIAPVGDDRVLAHTTVSGEGRESGAKLEGDLYICRWLPHGRTFREEHHLTVAGALRVLGLEGEGLEAAGLSE